MTQPPPKQAAWYRYTDAASIGIEIAVAVALCTVGGYYLERYVTHWSPWTTLLGVLVGVLAAAKAIMRTARTYKRQITESAPTDASQPTDREPDAASPGADR